MLNRKRKELRSVAPLTDREEGIPKLRIREMTLADLDGVMIVETLSYTTHWRRDDFYREIAFNQLANYYVAELNGQIAGFVGIWFVVDEAHITNIAVHPNFRGKKIGDKLLVHAIEKAKEKRTRRIVLEVRVSNWRAQNLYLKYNFRYAGLRKKYYHDNWEDAFLMEREIP